MAGEFLHHHTADRVANSVHCVDIELIHQPEHSISQPRKIHVLQRIRLAVPWHVPGNSVKASLRKNFQLVLKPQGPTTDAVQKNHRGT